MTAAITRFFYIAAIGFAVSAPASADGVTHDFGSTHAGQAVSRYTLRNNHGVTLKVTYGAIVTELDVPDRTGRPADIVLGFDSLSDYENHNGNIHFCAMIGRYANRMEGGRFSLDGYTTQPGLQFYPANGLDGSVAGKGGTAYRQGDAFALEAEHFPDAPNPAFASTVLKPGDTLHEVTLWKVGER
jgi:galactose mutarotase-like enzyme